MKRFLRQPFPYLILQAGLYLTLYTVLVGTQARHSGDSISYLELNMDTAGDMLQHMRTIGYPLFLRLVQYFSPNLDMLPQIQICMFGIAVLFFYRATRIFGMSKWFAFAAASALFYNRLLIQWGADVLTDVPALSMAVIAIGCLLLVIVRVGNLLAWAGLVVSLFLAYQFRPAYLFLVALIPVLALVLLRVRNPVAEWKNHCRKLMIGALAASVIPFAVFCSIRWAVVGHFGLTSYGALQLAGVTVQFLNRDIVRQLDEELQPLALAIIESRDARNLGLPEGLLMMPMPMFNNYFIACLFEVFVPAAQEFLNEKNGTTHPVKEFNELGGRIMAVNEVASRLAIATMRARPGVYILYYIKAFLFAVSFTLYVTGTVTALALVLFMAHGIFILRGNRNEQAGMLLQIDGEDRSLEFRTMLFLGGMFYLAHLLVVIPVVTPEGRYLCTAAAFIPSILVVDLLRTLKKGLLTNKKGLAMGL